MKTTNKVATATLQTSGGLAKELEVLMHPNHTTNEIPYGYCHCGCGQKTTVATKNHTKSGRVKGQALHFIKGHNFLRGTLEERFWSKIDRRGPNECWLWIGSLDTRGYGMIGVDGKLERAHRLSYELHVGVIPDKMFVCHSCDVNYAPGDISYRACCNPAHLWLGTRAENTLDMYAKGRNNNPRGEQVNTTKLTESDVIEIRRLRREGMTYAAISACYGLVASTVNRIVQRKTWRHIP